MGESKRRKDLGLPARKKIREKEDLDRFFDWLPITKKQLSRYPYAAPVTMAIGLTFLLVDWSSFNSAN